ncbi:MAG TPA: DUF1707 domain-containing protein [Actinomycetospora sp.]|jgi:hypothetical protein|uniref:DUF1707 SHOCT-like domain-containing protein n=1 Tax=Actinomycetospora sp. TaxID=1872135 RepID=UPI002F40EB2C
MTGLDQRGLRASDAEREAVVVRLHRAVGEGRLTAEEAGDRIAAVYDARFRAELACPVADLPATGAPVPGPLSWEGRPWEGPLSWQALWAQLLWRARTVLDGPGAACPTARQQRLVALLAGLAVLWTTIWVVLGASLA